MAATSEVTRYICLFHDSARASAAVSALENADVAAGSVTVLRGADQDGRTNPEALAELGVPDRDLSHLADGLRHGGVVVSLLASESRSDEIEKIFHHFSADKIDETELRSTEPVTAAMPLAQDSVRDVAGEAVIPIAAESLVVGKREVDRGGVRVYRRTVDEPVSEAVSLHDERVVLEHRSVDRVATEADVRAGGQSFELVETTEVPVVQKTARVVEEVRVGKVETDHTEVVQDSVRHTEVDIEPIETAVHPSGTSRD